MGADDDVFMLAFEPAVWIRTPPPTGGVAVIHTGAPWQGPSTMHPCAPRCTAQPAPPRTKQMLVLAAGVNVSAAVVALGTAAKTRASAAGHIVSPASPAPLAAARQPSRGASSRMRGIITGPFRVKIRPETCTLHSVSAPGLRNKCGVPRVLEASVSEER